MTNKDGMPPRHGSAWGVIALAVLSGVIASMQLGKVPPALSVIRPELSIGLVAAGWIASIFNATSAAFGVVAGIVTDRYGHFRMLGAGLVLLTAGSLLGGFAPNGESLLVARLFEGVGFVIIVVAAPSIIAAAAAPGDMRLAISIWGAYMPSGIALMMFASPYLIELLGWRGLWFANAGLTMATILLLAGYRGTILRMLHAYNLASTARSWRDVRIAITLPGPWLLGLCFTCYTIQWFAIMAWMPTYLTEQAGFAPGAAAAIAALVVLVNAPGNLLGGWALHAGMPRWTVLALGAAIMAFSGQGLFQEGVPVALKIALFLAFSLFGGMIPTAVLSSAPVHSPGPRQIGIVNGIYVQGSNIGSVLGPPTLAVAVLAFGGWQGSSLVLLLAATAGILLSFAVRRIERGPS